MREEGFALLLVLWVLVLIALIGLQLTSRARISIQLARNVATTAVLQAAANGAIESAIFGLLNGEQAPPQPGDGIYVTTTVEDQSGKINPNIAGAELLQAILRMSGYDSDLADRILDWRTEGRYPRRHGAKTAQYREAGLAYGPVEEPFRNLDELSFVLGITPAMAGDLRADMTLVYRGDPIPARASARMQAALALARGLAGNGDFKPRVDSAQAVCIAAIARNDAGTEASTEACVRLNSRQRDNLWEIVEWVEGGSAAAALIARVGTGASF